MITFRGIKSGPVAFLGFLSLKPFLAIETTQHKTKKGRVKHLFMRVNARRRVRRLFMMGKARRRKGVQGAQFSRLGSKWRIFSSQTYCV